MTASATRMIVDGTGRSLALGSELGRGGEGAVYAVATQPDIVAKLYHQPPAAAKAAKLAAMAALGTERLLRLTAWPVGTLHREAGGPVAGLLMPRIEGHQAIHTLYSPKSRLTAFPQAGWPFLVHAAANAARAFAAIHEHGHVIGDVNHGNLVVSPQATVKLIDCDSFQIAAGDLLYRCEVGVATHTPPELQGKSFREVTRTPNHDAFGLAVIIFQLLFMGRHPFSGAYSGPGEMPLERSISEFRFAYSKHAADYQMHAPPATPALVTVSPEVATLFERAFAAEGATVGRPTPQEWVPALTALGSSLTQCRQSRAHHYLKTLPACPWCPIERKAGVLLFGLASYDVKEAQSGFDLQAVWAQIAAVGPLLPADPPKFELEPSPQARDLAWKQRLWRFFSFPLWPIGAWIGGHLPAGIDQFGFPLGLAALVSSIVLFNTKGQQGRMETEAALQQATRRYLLVVDRWKAMAASEHFDQAWQDLEVISDRYRDLPKVRQERINELSGKARERQLQRFLDTFTLARADIDGIGPSRVALLQSYGIETAADVNRNAIIAVPGIGHVYTERLVDWRRAIEERFRFDARLGVDRVDVEAVDWGIEAERMELERTLRAAPAQLAQLKAEILNARDALWPELQQATYQLAQATANSKVQGG